MAQLMHARMVDLLPVPNVQELAARIKSPEDVPHKYIRPEINPDDLVHVSGIELPVIDLGRLLDPQFYQDESDKLVAACEDMGFFQLINHGVMSEVIEKIKADAVEFFKLPLEEKMKFAPLPNTIEGYGKNLFVSEDEKLNWSDRLYVVTRPLHFRNIKIWPSNPPSFREAISDYSLELKKVVGSLIEVLVKKLGLAPHVLSEKLKDQPQGIVFQYYPPCPKADKVYGISPHGDASVLSLVLQVNDVHGLQIKKNGKWLPLQPLPGAFVVNAGDILEIFTNGKYKSAEHRVMVDTEKERISIVAHHGAIQDATVSPLPELVKDGKANYKTLSYRDFMTGYFTTRHDGVRYLENMKLHG